jgi:hypothetical protein
MHRLASLVLMLSGAILSGQELVTFTGVIVDPSGARIPIADVRLFPPGSNEVVAAAGLLSVGSFVISAPPSQEYELRVQTRGFKDAQVKIGRAEPGQRIDLGSVVMEVVPLLYQPPPEPFDFPSLSPSKILIGASAKSLRTDRDISMRKFGSEPRSRPLD